MGWVADWPRLLDSLRSWQWAYAPLVMLAVVANYALRFFRWHYYLDVIGVRDGAPPLASPPPVVSAAPISLGAAPAGREPIRWTDSLLVFLAGFALTMTPGKLGEVLKSFLLKELNGTAVSYSASLVVVERLTDVLGMLLLASVGLATFQVGPQIPLVVLAASLLFVLVVQRRDWSLRLLGWLEGVPLVGRFAGLGRNLYESTFRLLRWKPLLLGILLAALAWFCECVAFFLVIAGLAGASVPSGPALLLQATFIYAFASLVGAVSFLPGGLGATEGSMALLLTRLGGLGADPAIAATLLVRFATLWFAVVLGVVALLIFQRRLPAVKGAGRT
jgi:glycosyltransferase 2 family protein